VTPLCVSVAEAAKMLGISQWMVRHLIARGVLARITLPSTNHPGEDNRRILISLEDLQAFVKGHREVARDV
jgi:hypothetical protein